MYSCLRLGFRGYFIIQFSSFPKWFMVAAAWLFAQRNAIAPWTITRKYMYIVYQARKPRNVAFLFSFFSWYYFVVLQKLQRSNRSFTASTKQHFFMTAQKIYNPRYYIYYSLFFLILRPTSSHPAALEHRTTTCDQIPRWLAISVDCLKKTFLGMHARLEKCCSKFLSGPRLARALFLYHQTVKTSQVVHISNTKNIQSWRAIFGCSVMTSAHNEFLFASTTFLRAWLYNFIFWELVPSS